LKKVFGAIFVIIALVMSLIIGALPAAAEAGSVVINEIMPNPSKVADSNGEWVELYNPTADDIDINGWTIKDDGNSSHVIDNGGPLLIPAGGYLVLGINDDPAENGGVDVAYSYYNPDPWAIQFLLANSGDEVVLLDAAGVEVDRTEYWRSYRGRSWALKSPALDNSDMANWYLSATTTYGAGDYGTPGQRNEYADDLIDESIDDVEELVDSGELGNGQGNALTSTLDAALDSLENENTTTTANQLNAVINKINAWIKAGKISEEEGQALIDAINEILATL